MIACHLVLRGSGKPGELAGRARRRSRKPARKQTLPQGLRSFLAALLALLPILARAGETPNPVIAAHARDLVSLAGDKLVPFKSDGFAKAPYLVLYFGAGWCPDCRRFSPTLVRTYDAQGESPKRFEVLLLTMDKTEADLLQFMRTEKMRWPALAFDKLADAGDLKKFYSGHGIPCLSVLNREGKLVLQSRSDQDAAEVLRQLADLPKEGR